MIATKARDPEEHPGGRPGDKILLEGGSCFYGSLKMEGGEDAGAGRRLTIGSYGNGRATIDAGDGTAIEIHDRGGIEIRDLIVTGAGLSSNKGFGVLVINSAARAIRLAHVRIENVEVLGFRWVGIYVGGDLCCDAPAGVRALAGFRDVRILRCVAHQNAHVGIQIGGRWDPAARGYAHEDVRIIRSAYDNDGDPDFHSGHSGNGILLENTDRGLIETSIAYRNGAAQRQPGGDLGSQCQSHPHPVLRGFRKPNWPMAEVTISMAASPIHLMQHNFSYRNDGSGYMIWNYTRAPYTVRHNVIRGNLSVDDARKRAYGAIHIGTTGAAIHDIEVEGNVVVLGNPTGAAPTALWIGPGAQDVRVHGNSFLVNGEASFTEIYDDPCPGSVPSESFPARRANRISRSSPGAKGKCASRNSGCYR